MLTGMGDDGIEGTRKLSNAAASCWLKTRRPASSGGCPAPLPCAGPGARNPAVDQYRDRHFCASAAKEVWFDESGRLRVCVQVSAVRFRADVGSREGVSRQVAAHPVGGDDGIRRLQSSGQRIASRPRCASRDRRHRGHDATNDTLFFRDKTPFDDLKTVMVPALIKARSSVKKLRIWCSAAATGQEPYSLLMLLQASFPELMNWSVNIVATDIAQLMIDRSREGIYSQFEVQRGLPIQPLVGNTLLKFKEVGRSRRPSASRSVGKGSISSNGSTTSVSLTWCCAAMSSSTSTSR